MLILLLYNQMHYNYFFHNRNILLLYAFLTAFSADLITYSITLKNDFSYAWYVNPYFGGL